MLLQVGMQCREVLVELGRQLVHAHLQGEGRGRGTPWLDNMYGMYIDK